MVTSQDFIQSQRLDSTQDCITHMAYQKKKEKGENGLTNV